MRKNFLYSDDCKFDPKSMNKRTEDVYKVVNNHIQINELLFDLEQTWDINLNMIENLSQENANNNKISRLISNIRELYNSKKKKQEKKKEIKSLILI